MQRLTPAELARQELANAKPTFSSIWVDNFKTTALYGPAPLSAILAGVGALLGLLLLNPLNGAMIGAMAGVVAFGPVIGSVLAFPFALIGRFTRKFKRNDEIAQAVNKFRSIHDAPVKQRIIDAIIAEDNSQRTGVRSQSSLFLKMDLEKTGPDSLQKKWVEIDSFINERSDCAYKHNGKKLFNNIINTINLDVIAPAQVHPAELDVHLRGEMRVAVKFIFAERMTRFGFSLFSRTPFAPKGIRQLRELLVNHNINSEDDMNLFDMDALRNLADQMKVIVCHRGQSEGILRDPFIERCYAFIRDMGVDMVKNLQRFTNHQGPALAQDDRINAMLAADPATRMDLIHRVMGRFAAPAA